MSLFNNLDSNEPNRHSTPPTKMTPVHLFSHGSTMMLGEESASASYWEKCGREALANGIEHVIMMVCIFPSHSLTHSLTHRVLPCRTLVFIYISSNPTHFHLHLHSPLSFSMNFACLLSPSSHNLSYTHHHLYPQPLL